MNGEAIVSVSAAVVALTQIAKWAGIPEKLGPLAVMLFAALGVGLWAYSTGTYQRPELFGYFAAWIAVATSAAGVFGFTRAAGSAVTSAQAPPSGGAGSNRVTNN
jgi:O-antigen/teichoic acid export membrane protein